MSFPGLFAYAATTEGITVRVQPDYAEEQSEPAAGQWVWRYHIRIENGSGRPVQLIDRYWLIVDGEGRLQEVRGEGVVGEQPLIAPGGSFDYVSGCPLPTPAGTMEGRYGMVDAEGRSFEIAIPAFDLVSPDSRRRAH